LLRGSGAGGYGHCAKIPGNFAKEWPKQTWVGVDAAGIVRYVWRIGDSGGLRRVPLALEALQAFAEAPA
jgi:hypothetical protein